MELLNISDLYVSETANQFAINAEEIDFPLAPQLVEVEQKLELNTAAGITIKAALLDTKSQWDYRDVEGIKLIHFAKKIYVPKTLRKRTLEWYHHYLCHPGGDRLATTLTQVCIWRGIVNQARAHCKHCSMCQKYKKRSTKYGHLPPKEVESLDPWNTVLCNIYSNVLLKVLLYIDDSSCS